jgi:hypothetical protein
MIHALQYTLFKEVNIIIQNCADDWKVFSGGMPDAAISTSDHAVKQGL